VLQKPDVHPWRHFRIRQGAHQKLRGALAGSKKPVGLACDPVHA
jgi:hypothetical protein